ncbi:uncharacterized protein [Miscanthus floridulus]|uniref:uncharacterized protein isoform X2 n=1 Tax=Miscanthus floridulus TaxID=154761 RepID=UPI003459EE7A
MVPCRRCRGRMRAVHSTAFGAGRAAQGWPPGKKLCRAEHLRRGWPQCLLAAGAGLRRRAGCRCWSRRPEAARAGPPSRLRGDKGAFGSYSASPVVAPAARVSLPCSISCTTVQDVDRAIQQKNGFPVPGRKIRVKLEMNQCSTEGTFAKGEYAMQVKDSDLKDEANETFPAGKHKRKSHKTDPALHLLSKDAMVSKEAPIGDPEKVKKSEKQSYRREGGAGRWGPADEAANLLMCQAGS